MHKKIIPYTLVLVPLLLVAVLSFFMINFYATQSRAHFIQEQHNSMQEYIKLEKFQSEEYVKELIELFAHKKSSVQVVLKKELYEKVNLAQKIATNIYEKNSKKRRRTKLIKEQIKDALATFVYNGTADSIFISDYSANMILRGSHLSIKNIAEYLDADYRSIVLEEIQKVRRRGSGYIESRRAKSAEKEIIYVKDLGFYKWYIGSSSIVKTKIEALKEDLLEMLKSMPIKNGNFLSIVEGNTKLYASNEFTLANNKKENTWYEDSTKSYFYYIKYYKSFDWYIVHGFEIASLREKLEVQFEQSEKSLEKELDYMVKVSEIIGFITFVFFLLFALKTNQLCRTIQEK